MASVEEISATYIEEMAAADPMAATSWGVAGYDDRLPDMSPAGLEERASLQRRALSALDTAPKETEGDRIAAEVMAERLSVGLEMHDAGDEFRALRVIFSPLDQVRRSFDLMRLEDESDWETVAIRMGAVPDALAGFRTTLEEGITRGLTAARRQVLACALQCETWGGLEDQTGSFFARLAGRYPGGPNEERLRAGVERASAAYLELGAWLRGTYLAQASSKRPGRTRALRAGGPLLHRIRARPRGHLRVRMGRALPDRGPDARRSASRSSPAPRSRRWSTTSSRTPPASSRASTTFQRWNQDLIDTTIAELNGVHFDIAEPIRRCEAMIAPPGGAAAMYYTGPERGLLPPGADVVPDAGQDPLPAVAGGLDLLPRGRPGPSPPGRPGALPLRHACTRFQRLAGFTSGHGEGWALYAERLMGELGYLDDPAYELGMLSAQAMRAVRVIVDIGMHLELEIPKAERYHPGERWTPELALPFVIERSCFPADFMASEVDRYLGLPGQAISYKVGERVWLESRQSAQGAQGGGVRPEGLPPLRARPRGHGPRPAGERAGPLLSGRLVEGSAAPDPVQQVDHEVAHLGARRRRVLGLGHIEAGLARARRSA